ncbi:MAG: hypothetical protein A2X77_04340 [Gammaproteobacteria bacterium GWE2_42_36]|nr:MAG: hypothetical protein A2X77_04340 [Gammaproteobacteria bacterium GWE2_42_36]
MKNLKSIFHIFAVIAIIPIAGFLVGSLVSHGYEKQYQNAAIQIIKETRGVDLRGNQPAINEIKLSDFCAQTNLNPKFSSTCDSYKQSKLLKYGSAIILLFTILAFVFIYLLGIFSLKNRNILFYIFRPGLFISQLCAAILVAVDVWVLVFSVYLAELFYLERIHLFLIGGLAIVGSLTAIEVFIKAIMPIKEIKAKVFGRILKKKEYPIIWEFVESLAKQVGTQAPDVIIAGMESTFFVIESKVVCLDGDVDGRILFLSLPFCRVLSKHELSAIIGHEMGHFSGEDTKWSKKFYPIYRGSIDTASSLQCPNSKNGLIHLALTPSSIFMFVFITAFAKSEKAINRQRELHADSVGASITSKEEMASALVKTHVYQYAWQFTMEKMKEALSNGKQIINASDFFSEICNIIFDSFAKNEIGKSSTVHPIDTHPPLLVRLTALDVELTEPYLNKLKSIDFDKAIRLIDNAEVLEKELTELEHYKLMQSGQIKPASSVK